MYLIYLYLKNLYKQKDNNSYYIENLKRKIMNKLTQVADVL